MKNRIVCPNCHRYIDTKLEKHGIQVDSESMRKIKCPYCSHRFQPGLQVTSSNHILCPKCHSHVDQSSIKVEEVYDKEYSTERNVGATIVSQGVGLAAAAVASFFGADPSQTHSWVSRGVKAMDKELVTGEPSFKKVATCPCCGHKWYI